uniref:Uncharacterized protein n=1 Tax=Ditylenchus dipsaci TaxID=166011 RepID=A0A915DIM8_9BILA
MTSISNFNCSKVDLSVAGKIAKNEPSSSGTNNQEDTDEEEREIEVLLQKTNFSFFHSKSAHANLSQMANKMEKISQRDIDEDEDSDEEFFVHQALLPLRKSKTSEFGAASSAQLANKSTRYYLETMAEMQKSFKSTYPAFQNTLPPEQLQKQINKNDSSQCSSSSNSSGSSSPAVPGCWSAPPVFSDHNSSNCSSGSHPSNDSLRLSKTTTTINKNMNKEIEVDELVIAKQTLHGKDCGTEFGVVRPRIVVDNRLEVEEKENDSVEVYESAEKMEEKMSTSSKMKPVKKRCCPEEVHLNMKMHWSLYVRMGQPFHNPPLSKQF